MRMPRLYITLPSDNPARVMQLEMKLEEYRSRKRPDEIEIIPTKLTYEIIVLERLLECGQVESWKLYRELMERYRGRFSIVHFTRALGVVCDYVETGGKNLFGGTGLPAVLIN